MTTFSSKKWLTRKAFESFEGIKGRFIPNPLQGVPKQWCEIIKKQSSICKICLTKGIKDKIMSSVHLLLRHGIKVLSMRKIFNGIIKPIVEGEREFGQNKLRMRIATRLTPLLETMLDIYKSYDL